MLKTTKLATALLTAAMSLGIGTGGVAIALIGARNGRKPSQDQDDAVPGASARGHRSSRGLGAARTQPNHSIPAGGTDRPGRRSRAALTGATPASAPPARSDSRRSRSAPAS